jgi:hypothetical protein
VTDRDSPSEVAIWERGYTEAEQVLYWLEKGKPELTIMRNGAPNSQNHLVYILPNDSIGGASSTGNHQLLLIPIFTSRNFLLSATVYLHLRLFFQLKLAS